MSERENILSRFSDDYLLSVIENRGAENVTNRYEHEYPELRANFRESAASLEILYSYLRTTELPSETEISGAYERIRTKLPETAVASSPLKKKSFPTLVIEQISGIFSRRPVWGGLGLVLSVTIVAAILWQPWQIKEQNGALAGKNEQVISQGQTGSGDLAVTEDHRSNPTDPTVMQDPLYRGPSSPTNSAGERHIDEQDAKRLQSLVNDGTILAPKQISLEGGDGGTILIRWSPSPNAIGYLVELRHANGKEFEAVRQTSEPHVILKGLTSGEKVAIRIVPLSGDRRGPASEAKSVVVP
jgi:hypothetical protein